MDILKFNKVYDENKKLDSLFIQLYDNSEDIILKNKLELLVELGELANETKCFKYWSKKMPNKDLVLEEYADTLLMVFYFFRELDIDLMDVFPNPIKEDINNKFITLYKLMSIFREEYTKDIIKEIFINLLDLGNLLKLTDNEIIYSCLNKIEIDKQRFTTNY